MAVSGSEAGVGEPAVFCGVVFQILDIAPEESTHVFVFLIATIPLAPFPPVRRTE